MRHVWRRVPRQPASQPASRHVFVHSFLAEGLSRYQTTTKDQAPKTAVRICDPQACQMTRRGVSATCIRSPPFLYETMAPFCPKETRGEGRARGRLTQCRACRTSRPACAGLGKPARPAKKHVVCALCPLLLPFPFLLVSNKEGGPPVTGWRLILRAGWSWLGLRRPLSLHQSCRESGVGGDCGQGEQKEPTGRNSRKAAGNTAWAGFFPPSSSLCFRYRSFCGRRLRTSGSAGRSGSMGPFRFP